MAQYRYDGPADILYKDADDTNGTKRGAIGTFSQDFVDRMSSSRKGNTQHRFTKVDDLKPAAVKEAKEVEYNKSVIEERNVVGVKAEEEKRK